MPGSHVSMRTPQIMVDETLLQLGVNTRRVIVPAGLLTGSEDHRIHAYHL